MRYTARRWITSEVPPRQSSNRKRSWSSGERRASFFCTLSRTLMVARLVSRTTSSCRERKHLAFFPLYPSFIYFLYINHFILPSLLSLHFNMPLILLFIHYCNHFSSFICPFLVPLHITSSLQKSLLIRINHYLSLNFLILSITSAIHLSCHLLLSFIHPAFLPFIPSSFKVLSFPP